MNRSQFLILRLFSMILISIMSAVTAAEPFDNIKPKPTWAKTISAPALYSIPQDYIKDGAYYLLLDRQVKASDEQVESYYQYVIEIVNQQGIDEFSQINISFDPYYQSLQLHKLEIEREGKKQDRISTSTLSVIQREKELEEQIYNGRKSLNILIDDIRVGDKLTYSYTRTGQNPVYHGLFARNYNLNWSIPVASLNIRVLWQKQQPLHYQVYQDHAELVKTQSTPAGTEYTINKQQIKPISGESNRPDWADPWAHIQFSETKNWQAIAKWGHSLYQDRYTRNDELILIANNIKKSTPNKHQQISQALRFVQDEVRYLGIEFGQNSHAPSPATETLTRRFGDCKDKTVLFIALLKELGISARPAMVDTDNEHVINDELPAINAFNHVITQVKLDDKTYWLDPTRSYQHGNIDSIYQPNYGYALLVDETQNTLTKMVINDDFSGINVKEVLTIPEDVSAPVSLVVESHYKGWKAASLRDDFEAEGLAQSSKDYLDYYQDEFGDTELLTALRIENDEENNIFSTFEHYNLNAFWDESDKKYTGNINTNIAASYLDKPDTLKRTQAYHLTYPIKLEHTIELNFERKDWSFKNNEKSEENDFFTYHYTANWDKKAQKLTLSYFYQSHQDHVPADRFDEYYQAILRARDYRYYNIYTYKNKTAHTGKNENLADNDTFYYWLIFGGSLGGFILLTLIWRLEKANESIAPETQLYPVSVTKFIYMSVFTMGIYHAYWFYKNFAYLKTQQQDNSYPVWRGIFNLVWYYPLAQGINKTLPDVNNNNRLSQPILILMAVGFFIASVTENTIESFWGLIAGFISLAFVIPLVLSVLNGNKHNPDGIAYNSRMHGRHFSLPLFYLPFMALMYSGELYLMPSNQVITGDKLWQHDVKTMTRQRIIKPNEELSHFYSSAYLFWSADGNGITDKSVFSYWRESQALQLEKATYDEISNIETKWGEDDEETLITITRKDGSDFFLYVSSIADKDHEFDQQLRQNWQVHLN